MSFTFWPPSLKARFVAASTRRNSRHAGRTARRGPLLLEHLQDRIAPATLTVNTANAGTNPSDGTLTLDDAVSAVNAGNENGLTAGEKNQVTGTFGVNDTIQFTSALGGATITLFVSLQISKSVVITGPGTGSLAISGTKSGLVLSTGTGDQVSLSGLTIENGNHLFGGGIANGGTMTVSNCTFLNNAASVMDDRGTLSGGQGGGIFNAATLTLSNCTFSGNSGFDGGGIFNEATLTVTNCTFSGNSATTDGGAIYNESRSDLESVPVPLAVTNCTFSGNSAGSLGGGLYNTAGAARLDNTIVANSSSGTDLGLGSGWLGGFLPAASFYGGYDLIGDGSVLSNFTHSIKGNPLLGPLANNGGPTQTMALESGSPAIDAGNNGMAVDANGNQLTTDQRGQPRILGAAVDIGAFESPGAAPVTPYSALAARTTAALGMTQSAESYTNFITAAYSQYLGRAPDAAGLAYWLSLMHNQGLSDEHLEAGFIGSQEYIANHGGAGQGWIAGMYQNLLGRTPAASEVQYWLNQLAAGQSTANIAYGFAASRERESNRVSADYQQYLGRSASSTEIQYWVNFFENGGSNEQVIAGFIGSQEYFQGNSSNTVDWLNAAYLAVLNRQPDATGLQYWEMQLGTFS